MSKKLISLESCNRRHILHQKNTSLILILIFFCIAGHEVVFAQSGETTDDSNNVEATLNATETTTIAPASSSEDIVSTPEAATTTLSDLATDANAGTTGSPVQGKDTPTTSAPVPSKSAVADFGADGPEDYSIEDVPPPSNSEVILVTGSRIPSSLDREATVMRLNKAALERTGLTSIGDILQQLPISGGSLNTKFNSSGNFGFPPDGGGIGAGAALADLRYLGPKRVLVLVDGVRWINGSSASGVSSATDLNTIPPSIIDRVEVLQDGASSIYGSDAISGVINIITKKNEQGLSANAYVGSYTEGDGVTQQYDIGWGQTSEKMSVYINASYVRQGEVNASDRDIARFPVPGFTACMTADCSSATPRGRFVLYDPNTQSNLNLTLNEQLSPRTQPVYDPANPSAGDFSGFTNSDRFNFSPFNYVLTPSERLGIFSQTQYKLVDTQSTSVNLFMRAMYNNRRSRNQAAPEPLFLGPGAGTGSRTDAISIDVTNPYNPFGFTLDSTYHLGQTTADGDPASGYFIGRRPVEAGPRLFEQNVDTWYIAGGAQGSFRVMSFDFFWDATALYSRNRADQLKSGAFNSQRLQTALGPIDVCSSEPGCVPFNIFGGEGTITPEMLRYVTFTQKDVSEQQLWDVTLNLGAQLFEMPGGGWLSAAIGFEHRDQFGFFQPDAVVVAGNSAGVPSSPTRGGFNVNELYGEIKAPISGYPGLDLLEMSVAGRFSDYSTFGPAGTLQGGIRWRPIQDILWRATLAQGFRAPGIGELFGTEARYDRNLTDPCSNYSDAPTSIQQRCQELGIPSNYEQTGSQISIITGGNRDLQPETSLSFTTSLTVSPSFLLDLSPIDQLSLEVTYYQIEVADAIQALDAQYQLDRCIRFRDDAFCDGIGRTEGGVINDFSNQLVNIGEIYTNGLDISLNYSSPTYAWGRVGVYWPSSFLFSYDITVPSADGSRTIERVGREVGDPEQAFPRFKSTLIMSWALGPWSASITGRYIAAVTEPCTGLRDFSDTCSDFDTVDDDLSENRIDDILYTDVQATYIYSMQDMDINITAGVNNVMNQDPPYCYSCALNGFDATTYNVPGVFGYLRAGISM